MTKEVRWKEEGKSLEYKFSLIENGKPVTYFGHQEYDAAMGVFVYRSKWGNNPETTSHEVHDITTGISRGISVPTPTNGEPSTTVLNKRVGDDQSEQTLETSLNGQVLYSHQITSTRINTAPTEPTLLGKKIIGKRFILEVDRDDDTKQKMILQFRENGTFEIAEIIDGEVDPKSDELTFKINGSKARVFENGKEEGGVTFNSDNPAIGDPVTLGSARRPTAGTIVGIEPVKPLSQIAQAESKPDTGLWVFETGGWVSSSPAIGSDGTVYVGSEDKKLYAINGKTGVKLWEFETGASVVSSPAIGSDGTVYVGSSDKKLYAIKTDSTGLAKSPWPMRGQNPQHTGRAPATQ
ncbi:MAG: PQQ-binding-like beta-propeller repeat protein [Pedosphaera sp.]|nr:PQQ-binding-like beta-propeller repeat protein [Pedosphaera sp.]